jgi:hypothetical protein
VLVYESRIEECDKRGFWSEIVLQAASRRRTLSVVTTALIE